LRKASTCHEFMAELLGAVTSEPIKGHGEDRERAVAEAKPQRGCGIRGVLSNGIGREIEIV
jgi:hypothetical protein